MIRVMRAIICCISVDGRSWKDAVKINASGNRLRVSRLREGGREGEGLLRCPVMSQKECLIYDLRVAYGMSLSEEIVD